jgi:hypothetical protein
MVKPIETSAFGRLFRSRHEARVACFLNEMGARWEYEPQGFELPSGRYLPDFKVYYHDRPAEFYWIECKPFDPTDREITLARELADATRCAVAFFTPSTFDAIRNWYIGMKDVYEEIYPGSTPTGDCDPMIVRMQFWDRPSKIDDEAGHCISFDLEPRWNWINAFHAANAALSQRFEFGAAPI